MAAPQKYVRLKKDGFVIDMGVNLRIIPDEMEVFETDVSPPEYIKDLTQWLVDQQTKKARKAVEASEEEPTIHRRGRKAATAVVEAETSE